MCNSRVEDIKVDLSQSFCCPNNLLTYWEEWADFDQIFERLFLIDSNKILRTRNSKFAIPISRTVGCGASDKVLFYKIFYCQLFYPLDSRITK